MSTITRYIVELPGGAELEYEEREYQDARDEAARSSGVVRAYEYEFADSYVVDDYSESNDEDEEVTA